MFPRTHISSRGYNTWTQGLYGYSWDMMIQTWATQHIRVSITFPNAKSFSSSRRICLPTTGLQASRHLNSGKCVKRNLRKLGVQDEERMAEYEPGFQQRLVDPRVDLTTVPWSPWKDTRILPLFHPMIGVRNSMTSAIGTGLKSRQALCLWPISQACRWALYKCYRNQSSHT